ncbi:MAG: glycosyltransferase family 2 protein [Nitrospirae bacterium]|nr:glycosyltransferase family 2 protein [Nitrospirota bacterium]
MKRRFTVIIATYNREDYLRQAIESVLAQKFTDYEFIVVDDGSTDRTQEIIRSYATKIKNIRQENQGSEMAYKTGVSHADGEYMAFLDSDDYFFPNALAIYDRIIRKLDSPPLIIGAMIRFWEGQNAPTEIGESSVIEVQKYRDYLSKDVLIGLAQSRIVMQKSLFEKAYGPQGNTTPCLLNDYNLMLQAGIYGPCVIAKQPVTIAYRQHTSQGSRNIEKMAEGVLSLVNMVRRGHCSGGRSRLLEKYAFLGGPVYEWGSKALKTHRPMLAFRVLIKGGPMVMVAMLRKLSFLFRRYAASISIAND